MTLLELMLVVVILGMAAGALAPALARRAAGDQLRDAAATMAREERHLRRLAIGSGGAVRFTRDGWTAQLAGEERRLAVASGVQVRVLTGSGEASAMTIDHGGRSIDRVVEVEGGAKTRRWLVAGLTGEWIEQPADPP